MAGSPPRTRPGAWQAGLGTWRGRLLGQAQRPRVPGICQLGAPDPLRVPPTPNCQKCLFWPLFGNIGGVVPSDRRRRRLVPGFCQPGALDPPGGTPHTPKSAAALGGVGGTPQGVWGPRLAESRDPGPPAPVRGATLPIDTKTGQNTHFSKSWVWGPSLLPNTARGQ